MKHKNCDGNDMGEGTKTEVGDETITVNYSNTNGNELGYITGKRAHGNEEYSGKAQNCNDKRKRSNEHQTGISEEQAGMNVEHKKRRKWIVVKQQKPVMIVEDPKKLLNTLTACGKSEVKKATKANRLKARRTQDAVVLGTAIVV